MMSDETPGLISRYYDAAAVDAQVARGNHRGITGGKWDTLGRLQFDFLVAQGLKPEHRLLDIGCGAFRGGVHAVAYLEPGHYFGIDLNQSILDAGYLQEIVPRGLDVRLPRANLACNGDFDFPWDVTFDHAIAQSLFTHLPFNLIRYCLARLAPKMRIGGTFFATYHAVPDDADLMAPRLHAGRESSPIRDPYHYKLRDFVYACAELPWRVEPVAEAAWPHPRQSILCFERLP
jgi:SAM-dependent methyltransferase